jgi:hypothetical protein
MNIRDSHENGIDEIDSLSFIKGIVFLLVACVSIATHLAILFAFSDRLSAAQIKVISNVITLEFYLLVALSLLSYLGGFVEEFELRSADEGDEDTGTAEADGNPVRFEAAEVGDEETDADRQGVGE